MNINAALGMTSERPLQVGDWVELLPSGRGMAYLDFATWPKQIIAVANDGFVRFDEINGPWNCNRFRRVNPPRERDEVAELREQLEQMTKERDELKMQVENDRVVIEEMNRQADQWSKRYRDVRGERDEAREILGLAVGRSEETLTHIVAQLREQLATVQAEAAAMREDVNVQYGKAQLAVDKEKAKSSHMRKVLEYIHAIGGCGLNVHERVDAALNTPAGRELLDELKAKDERIADLERQLAERDRDAELRRELRAWIKNGVFSVVGYSVVIGCQCIPTELAELLISIRDGGAK